MDYSDFIVCSFTENSIGLFVCLFGLMLNVPVNSYGHVGTVSSPNHIFFLAKGLTSTWCTCFRLLITKRMAVEIIS